MSNENNAPASPPSPAAPRRGSFSPGQSLSNMFGRSPSNSNNSAAANNNNNNNNNQGGNSAFQGSIASAAANAQNRRRVSISTLGLSGSPPGQTSPFGSANSRRASISSSVGTNSASLDESVIEEGDAPTNTPTTPFARRMSFGARALRDVRNGNGNEKANGRSSTMSVSNSHHTKGSNSSNNNSSNSASSPTLKARGRGNEGFNWSENLRSRAERTSSISNGGVNGGNTAPQMFSGNAPPNQQRAKSMAIPPAQEAPKPKAPDHFQERILKGDFYMD